MPKPLDLRIRNREHDANRRRQHQYRAWYGTARWQALRLAQLRTEPLCARCKAKGLVMEATVVHHRKAHKGEAALFWDPENLASSCAPCHDIDEQRIERGGKARQGISPDGWPLDAS